ncbi:hypothetical protein EAG_08960 [Camponotus floridanus]|uniref:Uncharacterized protein n=1 Tax=Camponotus floridanus TaxID=104421 RepID=E2AUL9_CAMFO|nr:hypothetical protein EAG_08960 [Camponotus floridanus]
MATFKKKKDEHDLHQFASRALNHHDIRTVAWFFTKIISSYFPESVASQMRSASITRSPLPHTSVRMRISLTGPAYKRIPPADFERTTNYRPRWKNRGSPPMPASLEIQHERVLRNEVLRKNGKEVRKHSGSVFSYGEQLFVFPSIENHRIALFTYGYKKVSGAAVKERGATKGQQSGVILCFSYLIGARSLESCAGDKSACCHPTFHLSTTIANFPFLRRKREGKNSDPNGDIDVSLNPSQRSFTRYTRMWNTDEYSRHIMEHTVLGKYS